MPASLAKTTGRGLWKTFVLTPIQVRQRPGRSVSLLRMSRLWTLLLSGPAPPDAAAVWFGDLPLDAPLECCYGPSNHAYPVYTQDRYRWCSAGQDDHPRRGFWV